MINSNRFWGSLFFIFLIPSGSAYGARPFIDYRCLARVSDYVLIGRPQKVSSNPMLSDFMGDIFKIRIGVVSKIKGDPEIKARSVQSFDVLWRKEDAHAAKFLIGQDYLLFVKNSEAGPYIVNGSEGALKLTSGVLKLYEKNLNRNAISIFLESQVKCPDLSFL